MIHDTVVFAPIDVGVVDVLFCDADGTLFDSEGSAFVASTSVTNRLLAALRVDRRLTPDELRRLAEGRTFRSTASALVADAGVMMEADALERWVLTERAAVTEELAAGLRPTPSVRGALDVLSHHVRLSVVTSSATARLHACLVATGLDDFFPVDVRFSAEDSLPAPTSKPDAAIYQFAGARMAAVGGRGLAVEDTVAGVRSAVAAGFPTVGMLQFVPPEERAERLAALRDVGVAAAVPSWRHLAQLLVTDNS